MKKLFVDTNIIVDLIADRKPFSKFAINLFSLAEDNEVSLFASSHSIATTHYLLKKYMDEKSLREVLYNLLDYLTVIGIDENVIKKGLRSKRKDFENSLQIICASSIDQLDCIVTRNIKDYVDSEIPAFSPDEVLDKI